MFSGVRKKSRLLIKQSKIRKLTNQCFPEDDANVLDQQVEEDVLRCCIAAPLSFPICQTLTTQTPPSLSNQPGTVKK